MSKDHFELPDNLQKNSRDAWRAAVEKSLGGRSLETALASTTYDGITIKPLYEASDIESISINPVRRAGNAAQGAPAWQRLQLLDIPAIDEANAQIKRDLDGGACGLYLSIGTDIPYGATSLALENQQDIDRLLSGVDLKDKTIWLSNGYEGLSVCAALINNLETNSSSLFDGNCGFDPLTLFAAMGAFPDPEKQAIADWVDAAHALQQSPVNLTPFIADGHAWQQAGASEAMELGFTLASALYYVRALSTSGMPLEDAFNSVDLGLIVSGDIFLSTAKLRAMRLLWSKVTEKANVKTNSRILAKMSYLDLAMKDPETNMLRATAATVAAGLGNADALVLLPYTSAHGAATPGARRLALNTQIISQEESHIGAIEDPAAGSWYIENLTAALAEKAWHYFRLSESQGGMAKMLRRGEVRKIIEPVAGAREKDIATAKRTITGVNLFPNLDEKQPDVLSRVDDGLRETGAQENGAANQDNLAAPGTGARFEDTRKFIKDGEPFLLLEESLEGPHSLLTMLGPLTNRNSASIDSLRSISDYIRVETGERPSVFVANIGKPSEFTARATWAKSYFETGGIQAIGNDGFDDLQALINGYKASGARIACICSSDQRYEEEAISTAKALREAGANGVYLVARPEVLLNIPAEERAHLHAVLYKGNDMILTLMEAHYLIGFEDEGLMV